MSNTLKRFTSHYNGYAFAIRAVGTLNYHGLVLLPWSSTRVVSVRHASSYTHTHTNRGFRFVAALRLQLVATVEKPHNIVNPVSCAESLGA